MNTEPLSASTRFAVVVNDDPTQLNVLALLVRKAGLEPRTFASAEAALAAMSAGVVPALIVTDLYLTGIDGWRFCRLLRSPEYLAFNQVPIVVVSATYAGAEAARITADLGAEAFLPSPVDGRRFCEQVRVILSGEQVRNPLRVLIVDDSAPFCDLLKQVFMNNGYEVETAFTAHAAAATFEKTAYDVAVLDYHLPDKPGDVLLEAFRAQRPDCVCLMMTIDPGPELALKWMNMGAAAYLQKPFKLEYLIELCSRARRERALLRAHDLLEVRIRELRESEARFATAFHLNPAAVNLATLNEGRIIDVNERYCQFFGYARDEVIGQTVPELRMWAEPASRDLFIQRLRADRSVREYEAQLRRKDGTVRDVLLSVEMIDYPGGSEPVFISMFTDITARKQAAEKLGQSYELLTNLARLVPGVIYQYRLYPDGRSAFPYASSGMYEIYEVTPEEVQQDATPVFGRLHPDDYERVGTSIQESARTLQTFYCEFRVVLPRQGLRWRWSQAHPQRLEDGGTLWHGIISDITERKQAEESLQESLREKVALLNEVHHRVKNNLQVITSLLRMEARRSEHPTTKTVLDEMKNRILSMALLHDSLYRSGTFASVDLGAYLKQLTNQSFRAQIVRSGSIRLQVNLTSVEVEMDQALPCGLLVNELISNCLKHGFPGDHSGEVRVELQPMIGGSQLRLRVSDTGVGLPADFEAKHSNSLGLQLVSSLARQIDGRLEIGPSPGAVFEVIFTPKHPKPIPSSPTP